MTAVVWLLAVGWAVHHGGPAGVLLALTVTVAVSVRQAYRDDQPAGYRGPTAGMW